jgi:hypothetical protein
MKRSYIDFHAVESGHRRIHNRLENWALWSEVRMRALVCPMFRLAIAKARARQQGVPRPAIDPVDALEIDRAVARLPELNRDVICWCYLERDAPARARRRLGCSYERLHELLHFSRQMLKIRAVVALDSQPTRIYCAQSAREDAYSPASV